MSKETLAKALADLGYIVVVGGGYIAGKNDYKKFIMKISADSDGEVIADIRATGNPDTCEDINQAFTKAGYAIDSSNPIL